MKGFLSTQGVEVGEKRISAALQRVDLVWHYKRQVQRYWETNPVSIM